MNLSIRAAQIADEQRQAGNKIISAKADVWARRVAFAQDIAKESPVECDAYVVVRWKMSIASQFEKLA